MTWIKAFLADSFDAGLPSGTPGDPARRGRSPRAAYSIEPVAPLRVPRFSLAFWGGVWGILLWRRQRYQGSALYWILALIIGAVAPSLVALFVVLPLKGRPAAGGGNPALIVGALLLNGAWGIGVATFMRLFRRLG
jgi:hypothetical protein